MGFFGKILEKLGLKKEAEVAAPAAAPAKPAAPAAAKPVAPAAAKPVAPAAAKPAVQTPAAPKEATVTKMEEPRPQAPKPVSEVDVVKHLDELAAGSGLDWKVSIVDLLKLLDIDSSREARNELATELGCPADLMKELGQNERLAAQGSFEADRRKRRKHSRQTFGLKNQFHKKQRGHQRLRCFYFRKSRFHRDLLKTNFTNNPARQNATAAMPCARTANKGGVWYV